MFVESGGIKVDCDVAIIDGSSPILLSLIDIQIRNKKICADLVKSKSMTLDFYDSKGKNLYSYRDDKFQFRSTPHGRYTHTIIRSKNIDQYCINWSDRDDVIVLCEYIQNVLFVPVTPQIVKEVMGSAIHKVDVYTHKANFVPTAYKVCKKTLLRRIEDIDIDFDSTDFDWSSINTIQDYLIKFLNPIKNRVQDNIKVLYDENNVDPVIFEGDIQPYKGQIPIIQSCIEVLKRDKVCYLAGSTGVGKSIMSTKVNTAIGSRTTLCVLPQTTISQWVKEIQSVVGDVDVFVIRKTTEFIKLYERHYDNGWNFEKPTYILMGKTTLKLDALRKPAFVERKGFCTCPDCGKVLENPLRNETEYLYPEDFNSLKKSNRVCCHCDTSMWQASFQKTKKTSVVNFIKRRNIRFDCIIVDEIHDASRSSSLVGAATRNLFPYGEKLILLSGTCNNAYSSSLHNILMAICPQKLIEDDCLRKEDFVKKYGTLQAIDTGGDSTYVRSGRSEIKDSKFKEVEGINPIVFTKYLLNNYVFCTLDEVGVNLPEITEEYVPIQADQSLKFAANSLSATIREVNPLMSAMYDMSIVSHFCNNGNGWGTVPVTGINGIEEIQPKNAAYTYSKDLEVLKIIKQEKSEGRKVCLYIDSIGNNCKYFSGQTIPTRLKNLLEDQGLKVLHIQASTVSPMKRKEYLDKRLPDVDVLIIQKSLVKVGLNLQIIPTYIFYEPSYCVLDVMQAKGRGMRINSTQDNRIYYLYYANVKVEDTIIKRQQLKVAESKALQAQFDFKIEKRVSRTASSLSKKIYDTLKS